MSHSGLTIIFNKAPAGDGGTGDQELLLAESYQIPNWFTEPTSTGNVGNIIMSIPDDATDHLIAISESISAATKSLHDLRTDTNYQVSSTGQLKLVVLITAGIANVTFKIRKHTVPDSAGGTVVYDFTNTTSLDSNDLITTPILNFDVTANDYISIETPTTSGITRAKAWIVEIPSA